MFPLSRALGLPLALCFVARAAAAWPTDPSVNVPVCVAAGDQGPPRAVYNGGSGFIVAWKDERAGGQIYAQNVSWIGAPIWAVNGQPLGPPGASSDPMIVSDRADGAVIAWIEDSGSSRALKAQRLDFNGVEQWASGGVTLRQRVDQPNPPDDSTWLWDQFVAAPDGAGGIFFCFRERHQEDNLIDPSRYTSQLVLLQCDGTGAVVDDRVLASDQYVCSFCGDGYFHLDDFSQLTVAPGVPAGVVVAYRARTIINHKTIFNPPEIRTLDPIAGWSATVATAPSASADVRHPRIATDGAGGAIASWEDTRGGAGPRLYAARVTAAGAQPWTAGGVPVSGGNGDQFSQEMVPGIPGEVVLAWLDRRNSSVSDLYTQRLNALGAPQWPGDVALCTQPTIETDLTLARTDNGALMFAWRDSRSGTGDIYTRFVSATGVAYGPPDGDAACTASGDQASPALVPLPESGFVTWMDHRGADTDVYAQLVGAGGPVSGLDTLPPQPPGPLLPWLWPNPSAGDAAILVYLGGDALGTVRIVDVRGRQVRELEVPHRTPGNQVVHWDGRDDAGREVANGVYWVELETDGRKISRRLAMIR